MSIVKSIGDAFRASNKDKPNKVDQYDILSPLMGVQDYATTGLDLIKLMAQSTNMVGILTGGISSTDKGQVAAASAYKEFIKGIPHQYVSKEREVPLYSLIASIESVVKNIGLVETNFPALFDVKNNELDESNIRSSSLVVIGYLETANDFITWAGSLIRHATEADYDLIPPFETKSLLLKADKFGQFAGFNLTNWNGNNESIITDIKKMQRKGIDVAIKSGDVWIDTSVSDAQFTPMETDLLSASMRSPILMFIDANIRIHQWLMELRTSRKEWLIAKINLETQKMRGLDPTSPEYKKLTKAIDHYSNLVSQYQQKIERARA